VIDALVLDALQLLLDIRCVDEADGRAPVAVVRGNDDDSMAGERAADVRVGVPGATKAVREDNDRPALGGCRRLENVGIGMYGNGGMVEKLGEQSTHAH
jgi:hypothetical protein